MTANDEKKRYTLTFAELLSALPGIAAIGGAVVYGVLTAAYSEYYAELGVRPSEVGLEFGPGLGGLAGVTVVLIGLLTLQVGATLLYLRFIPEPPRIPRFKLWVLGINLVLVGALFMIFFSRQANERADDAKDGIPVEPYRFLGLEILSLRADLAEVSLAAPKSEESEAYTRVRAAEKLLYLGRSEGSVVLYEPGVQSSWRLPASVFAVRALNCETKKDNKDPACP